MRRLVILVVAALIAPTAALGQDYTFGDWARDQGYSPGDVMPGSVQASNVGLTSLDGLNDFNWTSTPTVTLQLERNHLSSIESGAFDGLANLWELWLDSNELSSIESGAFSGLSNIWTLSMGSNPTLEDLNLTEAGFSKLSVMDLRDNVSVKSVSLKNSVVNQWSFFGLLDGGNFWGDLMTGIGDLDGITNMDLSGIDFADITDLEPLYAMDDLTDLWLVDTENLDAVALNVLLDNLETIESPDTEGILYMTQADFDAFNTAGGDLLSIWNAEQGHHVEFLQIGDVNHDTEVNGLDVDPFVRVLLASRFDVAADMNGDGMVNGLDVEPFVAAVIGGNAEPIPEPSTLLLGIVALGVVGGWRKRGR